MKTGTVLLGSKKPIGTVKTLKQYQNSPAEFDSIVKLKKSQVKTTAWEDNKGPEGYSTVRSVMIKAYPDFGYSYRQFKGSNKLWASDRSGAFTRKTVFNYDYNK